MTEDTDKDIIAKQKKQIEYMQLKCRQAGKAILDLEGQKVGLKKDIDRLSEENDNLRTMLKGTNE